MIIIDSPRWTSNGQQYSHMGSTLSLIELHQFAAKMGIKLCWFHSRKIPHYDIRKSKYQDMIHAGAHLVTSKLFVQLSIKKPSAKSSHKSSSVLLRNNATRQGKASRPA